MSTRACFRRPASAVVRFAVIALVVFTAIPLSADPVPAEIASAANPGTNVPAAQADFERLLEERDFGTFKIYQRLSAESRDEVFQSYGQGASIEQVKASVLKAFLHK